MDFGLSGALLVTGVGSGIGRAICEVAATHGMAVVAPDVDGEAAAATVRGIQAAARRR